MAQPTQTKPRLLIIGAGHRGNSYARATVESGLGVVAAVVEPIAFKRRSLGKKYVWLDQQPTPEQEFDDWKDFVAYEHQRRKDEAAGLPVPPGVDGVFVCVIDELHIHVVKALAPFGMHIMCEKPLATNLNDCVEMQHTLQLYPQRVFAIGHVLRYSPHNLLLRHLLLEKRVIGDVLSIEHVEPVGWWHFSHSFVRGHWRNSKTSAPALLTKSCHDIDFLLWMLCQPPPNSPVTAKPHVPSTISSAGSVKQFRRSQKPKEAGAATNCMSCPIKETCMYSAKRIYHDRFLAKGQTAWPVEIVNPQIGHILQTQGPSQAREALYASLAEDYDTTTTPVADIESRPWFGRCVYEADNDVCDDQTVTISWDDIPTSPQENITPQPTGHGAKTAIFHMIAQTRAQCQRRGWIYGTTGEIYYDSHNITVHDFTTEINDDETPNTNTNSTTPPSKPWAAAKISTRIYEPEVPQNSHHGGGDDGLTQQFLKAIIAVDGKKMGVQEAQVEFLGCTIEDCIRSHAAVFAAEEAREGKKVVEWDEWWAKNVRPILEAGEATGTSS
ncbi:Hypothetical protein R9X50_00480800 [Acrodontium crateriforme]|uniref:Gfo/Idh/MocA-like oxidoreductase N-terminal domain-containing protein n=1 Tax=Acrodontium crateriforme TaxID=150365 RepID=A0AAQ3M590_9PEZI|nr:Hypothetical protein R9X50_00480800 [Acrodontium crateriforme]